MDDFGALTLLSSITERTSTYVRPEKSTLMATGGLSILMYDDD